MQTIVQWFQTASLAGVTRGTWTLITLLVLAEMALGRSSDPRFRSLADSIRTVLGTIVAAIPVAGSPLVKLLRLVYIVPKPDALEAAIEQRLKSDEAARKTLPGS